MTLDAVRKTFTDWAPLYDATHGSALLKRREAVLALGLERGDRVLDLACGTGLNLAHLRERVGEEGHVTGVDLVPAMLRLANQRIARHRWKNVETREADAARLPFPEASFDKAICSFALNIIPDHVRAIREVERVLAPGGRFVSLEIQSTQGDVPGWLEHMAAVCAVDTRRQTLGPLQSAFTNVQVRRYWWGMISLAVAEKRAREPLASMGMTANVEVGTGEWTEGKRDGLENDLGLSSKPKESKTSSA